MSETSRIIRQPSNTRKSSFKEQLLILLWKNAILLKRNIFGTLFEITLSVFFVFTLLIIRYIVERYRFDQQNNPTYYVIDYFRNLADHNLLLFYPNTPVVNRIVNHAFDLIKSRKQWANLTVKGTDIPDASKLDPSTIKKLVGLVSFPSDYDLNLPDQIQYTLYTQEETSFEYNIGSTFYSRTYYMFNKEPEALCFDNRYFRMYNVFNSIKHAIDLSIIQIVSNTPLTDAKLVKIQQLNCQNHNQDDLKSEFSFIIPLIIEFSFMFTLLINVGNIVTEKQTKMKGYLEIVGIKWYINWISNMIRSFVVYLFLTILITIIGVIVLDPRKNEIYLTKKSLFTNTHFIVIFLTMLVYSIQVTIFTLLISQLFNRPFVARIFTIIVWLVTGINFYDNLPSSSLKYMFCIFPNMALTFAFQVIFQYERSGPNLDLSKLFTNIFDDPLNLGTILIMMLLYSTFYLPLTWYIDKILPGQFGIPLPFYFIFLPSYWSKKSLKDNNELNWTKINNPNYFQREPDNVEPTVRFKNVTKKFRSGFSKKKTAVNDLTLNLYENQITGFLGHNGAGKSTAIFMLCGIYPPSSGTIQIFGYDVSTQFDQFRSSIGFCPQHSILYDEMTIYEHLYLIASIKGYPKESLENEIIRISSLVGLDKDLKKKSKNLSGGMKRRLSLAMALVGDSKVIILDEPTSGLDPYNRRLLWSLIQKNKENRTIIMTTHFMEEADVLSDRIAIMNRGKLRCCGSPSFLKKNLGQGFRLTIGKRDQFDEHSFIKLISNYVFNFIIETNVATELCIGFSVKTNGSLVELLNELERYKNIIGIESYGISTTTIEEVFLKIGQIDDDSDSLYSTSFYASTYDLLNRNEQASSIFETEKLTNVFNKELSIASGSNRIYKQIFALIVKRFRTFISRAFIGLIILFLPLILETVFLMLIPSQTNLVNRYNNISQKLGSYELKMSNYGKFNMPYYASSSYSMIPIDSLLNNFYSKKNRPGVNLIELKNDNITKYVLNQRVRDVKNLVTDFYVGMTLNLTDSNRLYAKLFYSTLAFHSSAMIVHEYSNLLLAYLTKDFDKKIITFNSPLTSNDSLYNGDNFLEYLACIDILPISLLNMLNSLIVSFMISGLVIHVTRERTSGSKLLQYLSGTHYVTYWLSNYLFDIAICVFNFSTMIIAIKLVDLAKNDPSNETYPIAAESSIYNLYFLFLLSSLSCCTLAYIWSFLFKSDLISYITLAIILSVSSFLDMIWSFVQLFLNLDPETRNNDLSKSMVILKYIFMSLFPNVTIKRGLYNLKIRQNDYCIKSLNNLLKTDYRYNESMYSFREPGIGLMFFTLIAQFLVGNIILILLEYKNRYNLKFTRNGKLNKTLTDENLDQKLDDDVFIEYNRIMMSDMNQLIQSDPLVVKSLVKTYKKNSNVFNAVNDLNFGIPKGTCFGLLGLNGAGKTTLIRMLIGEIKSTSGKIFINGFNLDKEYSDARSSLGYCPQFSYLPEFLNVQECLELFADLRGLDRYITSQILVDLITLFKLERFKNRKIQDLSEGNKRKVSAALAFLGGPKIVILDEPTSGMDPASRRYFWSLIKKARDFGITILLSTHSMDESEALCNQIAIMAAGQFKCIGTSRHIKNKFGRGFSLIIKCRRSIEPTNDVAVLEKFIIENIPRSTIKETQYDSIFVRISYERSSSSKKKQNIADLFYLLESNKDYLNIESYSISETSLEQVFLFLAKSKNKLKTKRRDGYRI